MHEYSIIAALVDRVEREALRHPGAIVRKLHVRIGELAGVEVELLRTAYETFRAKTVCEVADLTIASIAAAWQCPKCKHAFAPGAVLRCTQCDRPATLAAGDDIILERIEMEEADV